MGRARYTVLEADAASIRNALHPKRRRSSSPWDSYKPEDILRPYIPPAPVVTYNDVVCIPTGQLRIWDQVVEPAPTGYRVTSVPKKMPQLKTPIVHTYIQYVVDWRKKDWGSFTKIAKLRSHGDNKDRPFFSTEQQRVVVNDLGNPMITDVRCAYYKESDTFLVSKWDEVYVKKEYLPPLPKLSRADWINTIDSDMVVWESNSKKVRYVGNPSIAAAIVYRYEQLSMTTKRQYLAMMRDLKRKGAVIVYDNRYPDRIAMIEYTGIAMDLIAKHPLRYSWRKFE